MFSVVISALEQSDFSIHIYPFSSLLFFSVMAYQGFPGGSAGKESACSAGDPGLVPGSGKILWSRERLLQTHIICCYI